MLARALSATGTERARVLEIAEAQARGDAQRGPERAPRRAPASPPACAATDAFVAKLKRRGEVEILQYRPSVQLPLTDVDRHRPRGLAGGRRACRSCSACACAATARCPGASVELLSISAPIGREASCPELTAELAAGARVEIARDEAPPATPPARFRAARCCSRPPRTPPTSPTEQALYQDGPEGRYLLDGDWLFRLDNADQGVKQRFMRSTSTAGWSTVKVPNVWNLGDAVQRVDGGRDRLVPQGLRAARARTRALAWAFRFESVNYRTRVWLNGTPIGENTGAYIPFEMRRRTRSSAAGTNRLVVRVDSRRLDTRLPARAA